MMQLVRRLQNRVCLRRGEQLAKAYPEGQQVAQGDRPVRRYRLVEAIYLSDSHVNL